MFAIICNARKGHSKGVDTLALVDRLRNRSLWWTSNDPSKVRAFSTRDEAEAALSKLSQNMPRIVAYERARNTLSAQMRNIADAEAEPRGIDLADGDLGWDGHKADA